MGQAVTHIAYAPSGRLLVSAATDATLFFFGVNQSVLAPLGFVQLETVPTALAWNPDSSGLVVCLDDGQILEYGTPAGDRSAAAAASGDYELDLKPTRVFDFVPPSDPEPDSETEAALEASEAEAAAAAAAAEAELDPRALAAAGAMFGGEALAGGGKEDVNLVITETGEVIFVDRHGNRTDMNTRFGSRTSRSRSGSWSGSYSYSDDEGSLSGDSFGAGLGGQRRRRRRRRRDDKGDGDDDGSADGEGESGDGDAEDGDDDNASVDISPVIAIVFLDRDTFVLSFGGSLAGVLYVCAWDEAEPVSIHPAPQPFVEAPSVPIRSMRLSADGARLVYGCDDGTVHVRHVADLEGTHDYENVHDMDEGSVLGVAASFDGSVVVSAGADGTLFVSEVVGQQAAKVRATLTPKVDRVEREAGDLVDITDPNAYSIHQAKLKVFKLSICCVVIAMNFFFPPFLFFV